MLSTVSNMMDVDHAMKSVPEPNPSAALEGGSDELELLMDKGFALAIQMLGCHQDAADVVQESLRKLVQGKGYKARRGTKQAWFLKVVRNGALDFIRRRKAHDPEWVERLEDRDRAPDREAEQKELDALLRRELACMRGEQREIILLRDFHDLSYAEIAMVMEIPQGTVMSRLHRARTELRERVRQYL